MAARAVGVPVGKVKIGLFMAVGLMAWFTGMHTLFLFNTIQSSEGVGNEFVYIIAAVVGGCLLTGGYGSAIGAAIGALIFGMVNQGIVYAAGTRTGSSSSSACCCSGQSCSTRSSGVVRRQQHDYSPEQPRRRRPRRPSATARRWSGWSTRASATAR